MYDFDVIYNWIYNGFIMQSMKKINSFLRSAKLSYHNALLSAGEFDTLLHFFQHKWILSGQPTAMPKNPTTLEVSWFLVLITHPLSMLVQDSFRHIFWAMGKLHYTFWKKNTLIWMGFIPWMDSSLQFGLLFS